MSCWRYTVDSTYMFTLDSDMVDNQIPSYNKEECQSTGHY